jgi:thymidylate synthase (FAD)
MKVTLTRVTENPVGAIEEAACNCYNSKPTGGKIMKSCYNSGHQSVLEFCDFTFHIEGVSRALTHQLVRHRLASYAQRSQRYCVEDDFGYVIPHSIKNNPNAFKMYENIMESLAEGYHALNSNLGIPAEDARMILPNACETQIEVKMNFRTLIHFMNERLCTRAQWEIREMAREMKACVEAQYPELAEYLVPKCEIRKDMPICYEHNCCGRAPQAKAVFSDYNKMKEVKEVVEKIRWGYHNSYEEGIDELLDLFPLLGENG